MNLLQGQFRGAPVLSKEHAAFSQAMPRIARLIRMKLGRLASELRRQLVSRRGRVTVGWRGTRIGHKCQFRAVGSGIIHVGNAVHFEDRVLLLSEGKILISDWVFINRDSMLVALEKIVVGEGTRIAERVSIRDHDHVFGSSKLPIRDQGYVTKPIEIGRECWIGCNAVILKGVTIGDYSVIGAGAVVTRDIPPHSLAAGVPARVIRTL